MDKLVNNKLYFLLSSALFGFIWLLNCSNKLSICAFIYVAIALVANIVGEFYGKKKAAYAISASIFLSALWFWNKDYYIYNTKINLILFGSFLSVLVSTHCGVNLFLKLREKYNFQISNFLSLALSSIIDCSIMASVLITKFSFEKVLFIFSKDIAFKLIYSLIFSLCIILAIYIAKNSRFGISPHRSYNDTFNS